MSLNSEKRVIKLVLVLATFIPIIATREETVETTKTSGAGEDNKESKSGKYPENFIQIPCIRYFITFQKKSMPMLALLD